MARKRSTGIQQSRVLTSAQEAGAILAAAGAKRSQIAADCGVALGTVSQWYETAHWVDRRNELIMDARSQVVAKLNSGQLTLLDLMEKAAGVLTAAMDAEDDEGHPILEIQMDAAKFVLGKLPITDTAALIAIAQAKGDAEGKAGATAPQSAIIHVTIDGATAAEIRAAETVDSTVVEEQD